MQRDLGHMAFTIPEILSLIGLVQCVYILVYMAFRSGGLRYVAVPFAYFLVLGLAFLSGFADRALGGFFIHYDIVLWGLWMCGAPLGVLLMIQIARIAEPPPWRSFWVLGLVPLAVVMAAALNRALGDTAFADWLGVTGLLAGVASLVAMWSQRPLLARLRAEPAGRDRYWLILTLVIVNLLLLGVMLLRLTPLVSPGEVEALRSLLGLVFVYLAGTSLFRIYPQAVRLVDRAAPRAALAPEDRAVAEKIENLLDLDKVYQEPTYSRAHLARELGISETTVSRIVNQRFGKTLPQLFNERRVAEAKRLLVDTREPVKTIAEEVGFNAVASFNRVFRALEGVSPGQFRDLHTKNKESG